MGLASVCWRRLALLVGVLVVSSGFLSSAQARSKATKAPLVPHPPAVVAPNVESSPPSPAPMKMPPETRGIWISNVDSTTYLSHRGVKLAVAEAAQARLNTLYPVVTNKNWFFYDTKALTEDGISAAMALPPEMQGRDILGEFVEAAQPRGLRVIPWFEYTFKTLTTTELFAKKGDTPWFTQKADGSRTFALSPKYQAAYLNPFYPPVQQFIISRLVEVVERYPVAGVQLDDHFGIPPEFGYDPYTVDLYRAEHNGKAPPLAPRTGNPELWEQDLAWTEWMIWRAQKMTDLLRQIRAALRASKNPNAILSLSPNPLRYSITYSAVDWLQVAREGLVDELVIQLYRREPQRFREEISRPEVREAQRYVPVVVGFLSGVAGKPIYFPSLLEEIQMARTAGLNGVSFFHQTYLWQTTDTPEYRQREFGALFPQTAPPSGKTPE